MGWVGGGGGGTLLGIMGMLTVPVRVGTGFVLLLVSHIIVYAVSTVWYIYNNRVITIQVALCAAALSTWSHSLFCMVMMDRDISCLFDQWSFYQSLETSPVKNFYILSISQYCILCSQCGDVRQV